MNLPGIDFPGSLGHDHDGMQQGIKTRFTHLIRRKGVEKWDA